MKFDQETMKELWYMSYVPLVPSSIKVPIGHSSKEFSNEEIWLRKEQVTMTENNFDEGNIIENW